MGDMGPARPARALVFGLVCAVLAAVIQTLVAGGWTWWGLAAAVTVGLPSALAGGRFDAFFEARGARADAEEGELAAYEQLQRGLAARREPYPNDESMADLLRPERAVVPFIGRQKELVELSEWCRSKDVCPVWLITGPGGLGKSRLVLELAEGLRASGWRCETTIQAGRETEQIRDLHALGSKSLLVVDYAESRDGLSQMLAELAHFARAGDGARLRILLVARQAGEWWTELGAGTPAVRGLVAQAGRTELTSELDLSRTDKEVADGAVPAFAFALGKRVPQVSLTLPLDQGRLPVLVLHAAALVAVLDAAEHRSSGVQAVVDLGVLDRLLGHEFRYWVHKAERMKLAASITVLQQVVAVFTLLGPDDESEARDALRRIPDLSSADTERLGQFIRWMRELYPGDEEGKWTRSLSPDLVAERHVVDQLTADKEFALNCTSGLSRIQAVRVLTTLTRADVHHNQASLVIEEALRANMGELALPAINVTVQTGPRLGRLLDEVLKEVPATFEELRTITEAMPYPTVALAYPAATVADRTFGLLPADVDLGDRGNLLSALSLRLAQVGRREEALNVITQAADVYRTLVKSNASGYLSELSRILNSRSNRLFELSRYEEALETIVESLAIQRKLSMEQPDSYTLDLISSLNGLSNCLTALGRHEEALDAATEAAAKCETMIERRPDDFLPHLAGIMSNRSNCLAVLDRHEEALQAVTEAVDIYTSLTKRQRDPLLPYLAGVFHNRSACLAKLGKYEEAICSANDAVRLRRALALARPESFFFDLAKSLSSLSGYLTTVGWLDEALCAIAEAIEICCVLARERPDEVFPGLADDYLLCSAILIDLSRPGEAAQPLMQGAAIAARYHLADRMDVSANLLQRLYVESPAAAIDIWNQVTGGEDLPSWLTTQYSGEA